MSEVLVPSKVLLAVKGVRTREDRPELESQFATYGMERFLTQELRGNIH